MRSFIPFLAVLWACLLNACQDSCPAPEAQLQVTVTANECAACTRLAIFAQSPQITAAIAAGKSPCAEALTNGPPGCLMGTVWLATYTDCGGSSCGPYNVDLSEEFLPAVSGASPAITDTVSFCPYDSDGATFTPAGNCVSSLSDQCNSSAMIHLVVDGNRTPQNTTDGGSVTDGGSAADAGPQCLANGSMCATAASCCSANCNCSNVCAPPPKIICH